MNPKQSHFSNFSNFHISLRNVFIINQFCTSRIRFLKSIFFRFSDFLHSRFQTSRNQLSWRMKQKKKWIWNDRFQSKSKTNQQFWQIRLQTKWFRNERSHFSIKFHDWSTSEVYEYHNDSHKNESTISEFVWCFVVIKFWFWFDLKSKFELNQILNIKKNKILWFRWKKRSDRFDSKTSRFLSRHLCFCESFKKYDFFTKKKQVANSHFSMFTKKRHNLTYHRVIENEKKKFSNNYDDLMKKCFVSSIQKTSFSDFN